MISVELKKRIFTALAGVTALLGLILFLGVTGSWFVATVVASGIILEFGDLVYSLNDKKQKRTLLLVLMIVLSFGSYSAELKLVFELVALSILFLVAYFLFTSTRHEKPLLLQHLQELAFSVLGLIYVAFVPAFWTSIRASHDGLHWVMIFLLINWSADIGAYFIGVKFGRRKLFPSVSPKKSVEGAVAGIVSAIVVAVVYSQVWLPGYSIMVPILVAAIVSVASQIGDLSESFIKRVFDKKDSSSLLPGHGGFFDRFDGVVFSIPIMYICVKFLT